VTNIRLDNSDISALRLPLLLAAGRHIWYSGERRRALSTHPVPPSLYQT